MICVGCGSLCSWAVRLGVGKMTGQSRAELDTAIRTRPLTAARGLQRRVRF
jgi:hypothetical protein